MIKEKIKKFCIKEDGNALIMVVLLVLCMMLIAGGVMAVSFSHVEISHAYKRTSNLYYAAQSGAEKMVDKINKELLKEMPQLMEEAFIETKNEVAPPDPEDPADSRPDPDYSNLAYRTDTDHPAPYQGEFLFDNRYEDLLKQKAIEVIVGPDMPDPDDILDDFDYVLKDERHHAKVHVEIKPKIESGTVNGFLVTSTATLEKSPGDTLSEIKIEGDIIISDLINHKELFLEEYRWKDDNLIPNTFRSPIVTFGDLVITNDSEVTINGDVRAKGYIPPDKIEREPGEYFYPELEEYGGIYVAHGGQLTVNGDIITLSNLHTIKETDDGSNMDTFITVNGDVFANSVAIEDDYPYYSSTGANTGRLTNDRVIGQKITIDGDVYVDNDIAIDRYVKGSSSEPDINIKGSVFGITNFDGSSTEPDPNKSSGIYAMGEDTQIQIGKNAFVHGNAFISFDEGKNFSALYESMGEPYNDVRFLDAYNNNDPDSDHSYLGVRSIITNRIKLDIGDLSEPTGNYFYAPYMISAIDISDTEGRLYRGNEDPTSDIASYGLATIRNHDAFNQPNELENLFNKGNVDTSDLEALNLDWNETVIEGSSYTIKDIINNALSFLKGEDDTINPFKRNYFIAGEGNYGSMSYYRGIQGYMFLRRDIFYKGIDVSSATNPTPEEMSFNGDIINSSITIPTNDDTENTPIYIYNSTTAPGENIDIDIKQFYKGNNEINNIIVDTGQGTITLGSSDNSKRNFNGLIVSNGQVKFDNSLGYSVSNFNGIIIAKGKNNGSTNMTTTELVSGEYAGVLITVDDPLEITYDSDILFKVRCKDRSIKRAIFDYLGLTNYVSDTDVVSEILQPSIAIEDIQKVDFSPNSVIDIKNTQAYKGVRFEMKTLRQVD